MQTIKGIFNQCDVVTMASISTHVQQVPQLNETTVWSEHAYRCVIVWLSSNNHTTAHRLPWKSGSPDYFNRFVDQRSHVTITFYRIILQKKTKAIIDNINNLIIMKKENIEIGTFHHEFFDENHEKEQMREKWVRRARGSFLFGEKKSSPSIVAVSSSWLLLHLFVMALSGCAAHSGDLPDRSEI